MDHCAVVALAEEAGEEVGLGVARCVRLEERESAELAVTVIDAYQGRGLGYALLQSLAGEALRQGITRFEGDTLAENTPMRALLRRAGARSHPGGEGVVRFELDLPLRAETHTSLL